MKDDVRSQSRYEVRGMRYEPKPLHHIPARRIKDESFYYLSASGRGAYEPFMRDGQRPTVVV
jgi:hypothetical protein